MSHAGLGLKEEPLHKNTLRAWDLGHEVTWVPLLPVNPLVHHTLARSRRFTRTLGPRSWSTLPLSQ